MSEIVNKWWYSSFNGNIGIVKVHDDINNQDKFYIDVCEGTDENIDAEKIKTFGAKFYPEQVS